ncbi:Protein DEHYDRATION-INDUCED 19-like 5 [Mucuna pruriens]|uniref:Protein DEHYDRATION-INDUCED 19-like 5 n=1 Tax=Mucuna pruriens TaxID=157652 RepID=A0A371I3I0_MUCPR|nr:Protein DEHYDRATION-INDUCED 19-like 5 [Mucuna pruriens]
MEDATFSFGLSTASRSYRSKLKSHFAELFIDFDEENGDDDLRTAYPCPFCAEDFDLLELCCHIDLDHPIEAQSGICPVCTMWVGTNMVDHIAAQHGNLQLKSKCYKHESYPALSFSRKGEQDGHWHSFSAGLSPVMSTSKTACDPLLSFLYGASADNGSKYMQPDSSSEVSIEVHSNDEVLERDTQPSLSDKDQLEKAQRSKFVQGLLMSAIFDPDY